MRPKLAIVGSHQDTRDLAPFDDHDFDIWVFNEALSQVIHNSKGEPYHWVKRADAVFQLHLPVVYRSPNNRSDQFHWNWLQEDHGDLKIYMQEVDPLVPNSIQLPLEELKSMLSNFKQGIVPEDRIYLTSTPAIALAMGILLGYEYIEIYGCNMASDTEYHFQREGFTFWIGYAIGKGITVHMLSGDDIFDRPVYGYDGYVLTTPESFRERIAVLTPALEAARANMRAIEEKFNEGWSNGAGDYIADAGVSKTNIGVLEGQLFENERYLFKVEQMQRDGEFPFIDRNEYEMAAAAANRALLDAGPQVYRTVGHIDMSLATWNFNKNPAYLPQLQFHVKDYLEANYKFGREDGKYQENRRLAMEMDKRLKAAGGIKTVQSVLGLPDK